MSAHPLNLSHRERAILLAVTGGRAEITASCEPDLYVDGLACCDQSTAHSLARKGLITAATTARIGERVPATLTDLGKALLAP